MSKLQRANNQLHKILQTLCKEERLLERQICNAPDHDRASLLARKRKLREQINKLHIRGFVLRATAKEREEE